MYVFMVFRQYSVLSPLLVVLLECSDIVQLILLFFVDNIIIVYTKPDSF